MNKYLNFFILLFGISFLLFSESKANQNDKYCAAPDLHELYNNYYCDYDVMWDADFNWKKPPIILNKKVYLLMEEVTKKVVIELKRREKRTGKNQGHLFYDLLIKYRLQIYNQYETELLALANKTKEQKKKAKEAELNKLIPKYMVYKSLKTPKYLHFF